MAEIIQLNMKKFSFHMALVGIIENNVLLFIESKYLPSLTGKLDNEGSLDPSFYRFTASLRRYDVHICPATLLSNKHALTAATCLNLILNKTKIPSFDTFSLVAGRFDIDNGTTVFEIEKVQVHESFFFNSPRSIYNIGLITVNH